RFGLETPIGPVAPRSSGGGGQTPSVYLAGAPAASFHVAACISQGVCLSLGGWYSGEGSGRLPLPPAPVGAVSRAALRAGTAPPGTARRARARGRSLHSAGRRGAGVKGNRR